MGSKSETISVSWPNEMRSWLQTSGGRYYSFPYGRKLLISGMGELQSSMSLGYNSKVARMGVHIGGLVDFEVPAISGPGWSLMPDVCMNWPRR